MTGGTGATTTGRQGPHGRRALAIALVATLVPLAAAALPPGRDPVPATPAPRVATASARCTDDDGANRLLAVTADAPAAAPEAGPPRATLLTLVREAVRRSQSVGAAQLLAEAARLDVKETQAGWLPQVNLGVAGNGVDTQADPMPSQRGNQVQGSLTATGPLYDGGRLRAMAGYRDHLAEAARLGRLDAEEQVALQTVSLALDRARFEAQARVYAQYAAKMSCLVDALQDIVAADRGRASELVQARKSQAQAELARAQTLAQERITEVRLKRFVGDALPPADDRMDLLLDTPPLPQLLEVAAQSAAIEGLDQQADALDAYVKAVLAGDRPQLSWLVSASKLNGMGNGHSYAAGLSLTVPLFNGATRYAADAARRRALAARLQKQDALEARQERMAEVHEDASFAMDRARRIAGIVRDSDRVRNDTLQQWQQLGRRSLFDVMSAEGDHYNSRIEYVNALFDAQQANALLWSLGTGLAIRLE